jgi:hypothetical protein
MTDLTLLATKNIKDIITQAIRLEPTEHALVIYDTDAPLTRIVHEGYKNALPEGEFMDFNTHTPAQILARISELKAKDLVVVLQSTNFRLNEFRLRIELFNRDLKTIEHMHLMRLGEDQFERYINSLAYDSDYYHRYGHGVKKMIDEATEIIVSCAGTTLTYVGGMEDGKLNIGDYTGMKNVGGTYPIGEVFSEAKDLTKVNGEVMVFGYAGADHCVRIVEPFKGTIKEGIFEASPDAPQEFLDILDLVRKDEPVWVREFGMGLNPTMGKDRIVNDITAFERQKGMHMSLGMKHGIYPKPGFSRKDGRYHVDIFIDMETITADGKPMYKDGDFIIA